MCQTGKMSQILPSQAENMSQDALENIYRAPRKILSERRSRNRCLLRESLLWSTRYIHRYLNTDVSSAARNPRL
jgi:hypothetical protein